MTTGRVRVVGGILAAALAASTLDDGAATGQDAKPRVFTVGTRQHVDSMNPTVGVTVAAHEAWNIQYATLTERAARDFSVTPGLAESWEGSADRRTWTYELRPGLKWSDGKPLTAADIAYTVNRSREEEWLNHSATVANLKAKAIDSTTVAIRSSVPDPKLPVMDAYIVPKHVYEKLDAGEVTKHDGRDGVGSGPYVLDEFEKGRFARFTANPHYWRGKPPLEAVVIRDFDDAETMVAALRRGEIDAAHGITGAAYDRLEGDEGIEVVEGSQGAFQELALNGGDGLRKGHPALADPLVRRAIAHAIDKQALVDGVEGGHAKVADTIAPSANPAWMPEIPDEEKYAFDLERARSLLDQGRYEDTDGDGVREMPGGGRPLRMRYAVRSESPVSQPAAELITGWLREIGIATTQEVYDDRRLTDAIGKGDYDMFVWGWVPFVDPDPMLSYFTCSQVSRDPDDPTDYHNDANFCDPGYDRRYKRQKVELDPDERREIVHEMLARLAGTAVYDALYTYPELQAYRTGKLEGFVRQPEGTGPVLFSSSSPTYWNLKPVSEGSGAAVAGDAGGIGRGAIVGIAALALALAGAARWAVIRR